MGQTCCTHKNVENSQTLVRDENKTQPDADKTASKQDLAGTDETASKHGKNKDFEKQISNQLKQNRTPTQENDQDRESYKKSKSKNEDKDKVQTKDRERENEIEKRKSSQIDNAISSNLANEAKQINTLPGNDEFDNQSKKNKESGGSKVKENKKEPSIDLFMDLPGPPPNLREINKKAQSQKNYKSDIQLKSD